MTTPSSRLSNDSNRSSVDDLTLDLDELDPQSTPRPPSSRRQPSYSSRPSYDFGRRIPLRNLRFGGRRRPQNEDEDAEDLNGLIGDDDLDGGQKRTREGSAWEQDDAPLLSNGSGALRRRFSQQGGLWQYPEIRPRQQRWGGISSKLRKHIPFLSSPSALLSLPDPDPESSAEDNLTGSSPRTVKLTRKQLTTYPANAISNAKYTALSFLPRTLFNEFKFFFNLYFLLVALSQIIPALRIGYLSTYVAPLAFVIGVTLGKEAWDDLGRRRRDREANSESVRVLVFDGRVGGGYVNGSRKGKGSRREGTGRGKRKRVDRDSERLGEMEELEEGVEGSASFEPSSTVREAMKPSKDLRVGDIIVLGKNQRVPADVVILKSLSSDTAAATTPSASLEQEAVLGEQLDNGTTSSDPSGGGEAFIRTDQLDGETDWKLRLACPLAQTLPTSEYVRLRISADKPSKRVNEFVGTLALDPKQPKSSAGYDPPISSQDQATTNDDEPPSEPQTSALTIDNTAWSNTVLASSTTVHAAVLYTGPQTRAALSTSASRSKTGLLELEINSLTKILCFLTAALSFTLVALEEFESADSSNGTNESQQTRSWYILALRFLILFSTIVPISLRVNLDMGKSVYAYFIQRDEGIPDTVVRTSTIPEDLGRVEYLLTDKTGTLTRNEMVLRKVHVGTVSYGGEAMVEVGGYVNGAFGEETGSDKGLYTPSNSNSFVTGGAAGAAAASTTRTRREIGVRVRDLVLALALCHNVTPTSDTNMDGEVETSYQASSPDEIAIVRWTEQVGLRLAHRDRTSMTLVSSATGKVAVMAEVLRVFPFTSDSKRMGIIVRFFRFENDVSAEGDVVFFQKGADTVMSSIVAANDWLDEETANMAREGLRTLVIGRKSLSKDHYSAFAAAYSEASLALQGREAEVARVVKHHLEHNLDLLGVTGVEDKLQAHVKPSLELLRNAGVKIWMLTGDKPETARCVAISSKLVSRGQHIHNITNLKRKEAALEALSPLHNQPTSALLIDGQSLSLYLTYHREAFINLAVRLPTVIATRCSPTQKATLALLIRHTTRKRTACIGDGGNDVSMIQAADVGLGIVGKEGQQASLAADFSLTQFSHLTKLLVWHGRNSYKRSAKLAQFVMHRGLVISVCQTVFSVASHFEPIALYRDWLLVGYATIYTMAPVFSLVLDKDVDENLANLYPELYRELTLGRSLSYRTFFIWLGISIYQGLIIQGGSELLVPSYTSTVPDASTHALTNSKGFKQMVALSYTVLVVNELIMVAAEVTTWHPIMIFSILGTAAAYFGSLPFLGGYFDLTFVLGLGFWWRFAAISAASLVPVWAGKVIRRTVRPPSYRKVRGV